MAEEGLGFPLLSEMAFLYTSLKIYRHVIIGAAFKNSAIFCMEIVVG